MKKSKSNPYGALIHVNENDRAKLIAAMREIIARTNRAARAAAKCEKSEKK